VVLFVFLLTFELFRQCGIICFSIDLWTVPTVWYYLFFYWPLNCSDSVVLFVFLLIFELFRQCGIICFSIDLWTVPTVWYYLFFYWPLNCSDSVVLCFSIDLWTVPTVVLFVFLLTFELFRQCGIMCFHFITIYRLFSCLLLNHGSIVIMCFLFWVIVYWIKFITFLVVCVILLYFRIFKWYSNLYPSILSISIPIKLTTY
jgi:hypothetical protein